MTKIAARITAGLLVFAAFAGTAPTTASAAVKLTIPDNYAAILDLGAVKWNDTDSTGHKAGAVIEKAVDSIGTLVCYYVPDDYRQYVDTVITRTANGGGTFYFIIGYAPDASKEYKRGLAAILCSPDEVDGDTSPAIFVEDLRAKFGTTAAIKPTETTAPSTTAKPTTKTTTATEPTATTYTDAEFAAEVIKLINAEREKAGVKPLTIDEKLCEIATLKAKEMVDLGYFSHTSPNYGTPRNFAKHYGYKNYATFAENLYWGRIAEPSELVAAWVNSTKGHKEVMLNPTYTKAGVGFSGNKYALELAKN